MKSGASSAKVTGEGGEQLHESPITATSSHGSVTIRTPPMSMTRQA